VYTVTVKYSFSAAHRIREYEGNCERMHGHNWEVQVTAAAEDVDDSGMVMDFRDLRKALRQATAALDHSVLNDVKPFDQVNPTAESIARYIYTKVCDQHRPAGVSILQVMVAESEKCWATYSPDGSSVGGRVNT